MGESARRRHSEYGEVLSAMPQQLGEDYPELLDARDGAKQELVRTLNDRQRTKLLLLEERQDEVHIRHLLAAYQAGRDAAGHN